jgi:hypothetical protein
MVRGSIAGPHGFFTYTLHRNWDRRSEYEVKVRLHPMSINSASYKR